MKKFGKAFLAVLALGLTAYLAQELPRWDEASETAPHAPLTVVRVWVGEQESAFKGWLKKRAAAYEKETGKRVYLRTVSGSDLSVLEQADSGAVPPDAAVLPAGGTPIALRGYALIVRDETAAAVTPQATGALFFRPSPTPGPSPAPAAWPDSLGAVLAPEELLNALPGTVKSASPAEELAAGKAQSALLTPGQAARLPFGYQFYALPGGGGFVPIGANAYSEAGNAFVQYLLREDSQRALEAHGLFSPFLRLYGPDDPLRYRLDQERPGAEG